MKLDIKATGNYSTAYFENKAVRLNVIGNTTYYCLTDLLDQFNLVNNKNLLNMLGEECKVVKMLNNNGNPSPMKAVTTKGMQMLWQAMESGELKQKSKQSAIANENNESNQVADSDSPITQKQESVIIEDNLDSVIKSISEDSSNIESNDPVFALEETPSINHEEEELPVKESSEQDNTPIAVGLLEEESFMENNDPVEESSLPTNESNPLINSDSEDPAQPPIQEKEETASDYQKRIKAAKEAIDAAFNQQDQPWGLIVERHFGDSDNNKHVPIAEDDSSSNNQEKIKAAKEAIDAAFKQKDQPWGLIAEKYLGDSNNNKHVQIAEADSSSSTEDYSTEDSITQNNDPVIDDDKELDKNLQAKASITDTEQPKEVSQETLTDINQKISLIQETINLINKSNVKKVIEGLRQAKEQVESLKAMISEPNNQQTVPPQQPVLNIPNSITVNHHVKIEDFPMTLDPDLGPVISSTPRQVRLKSLDELDFGALLQQIVDSKQAIKKESMQTEEEESQKQSPRMTKEETFEWIAMMDSAIAGGGEPLHLPQVQTADTKIWLTWVNKDWWMPVGTACMILSSFHNDNQLLLDEIEKMLSTPKPKTFMADYVQTIQKTTGISKLKLMVYRDIWWVALNDMRLLLNNHPDYPLEQELRAETLLWTPVKYQKPEEVTNMQTICRLYLLSH